MGLFDSQWTAAVDADTLQEGASVRVGLDYWVAPGFNPGSEEWARALEGSASILVTSIAGVGDLFRPFGSGGAGVEIQGTIAPGPIDAGELRGELLAAVADLNQNRAVGVSQPRVSFIERYVGDAPSAEGGGGFGLPWSTSVGLGALAILALVFWWFFRDLKK